MRKRKRGGGKMKELCPLYVISTNGNEATSECRETRCAWWIIKHIAQVGEKPPEPETTGKCALVELAQK